jgi:SAM-dependent methyltransferase
MTITPATKKDRLPGWWLWRIYAQCYDVLWVLRPYRQMLADLLDALEIAPGMRVLDLGCGTGNLERLLEERGTACEVVAVDYAPEMLARARAKCSAAEYLRWDLNAPLPYPAGSFQRIVSCNALYALRDPCAALRAFAVLLAPGGRMVHTVPRRGYHLFGAARRHWLDASRAERLHTLSCLPALLLVLLCNVYIYLTQRNHRVLRDARQAGIELRTAEDLAQFCALPAGETRTAATYAGENWVIIYTRGDSATA